jgi:hypothetical protein
MERGQHAHRDSGLISRLSVGLSFAALGVLFATAVVRAGIGLESLEMIRAFNMDEHSAVSSLVEHLHDRDLDPHGFYNYGYAYIALAYWALRALEALGCETSVYSAAYALRIISLAACVAVLTITYRILRSIKVERALAWIAIVALASVPTFNKYSTFVHPDLQQCALLTMAAYGLRGTLTTSQLLCSALLTGIAFGTKYSGAFFLPLVLAAAVLREPSVQATSRLQRSTRIFALAAGIVVAFCLGWLLTNPYVLANWHEVLADIQFESAHVGRGHGRVESTNPLMWLALFSEELTWGGTALLIAGFAAAFVHQALEWKRRSGSLSRRVIVFLKSPQRRFILLMMLFVLACIVHLTTAVNMRRTRYTFHFLPVLLVLSMLGLGWALANINRTWLRSGLSLALSILAVALALRTVHLHRDWFSRYSDPRVRIGIWLDRQYDARASVLTDQYVYVPPRFLKVTVRNGITQRSIKSIRSSVFVLSRAMTGRFCWMRPDTRFIAADFQCSQHDGVEAYKSLLPWLSSETSGYRIVHETEEFLVFEKVKRATDA